MSYAPVTSPFAMGWVKEDNVWVPHCSFVRALHGKIKYSHSVTTFTSICYQCSYSDVVVDVTIYIYVSTKNGDVVYRVITDILLVTAPKCKGPRRKE